MEVECTKKRKDFIADSDNGDEAMMCTDNTKSEINLLDLSNEVILCILKHCHPQDLKSLGFCCERLANLVLDRSLWFDVDARGRPFDTRQVSWIVSKLLHDQTTSFAVSGHAVETSNCMGYTSGKRPLGTKSKAKEAVDDQSSNQDRGSQVAGEYTVPPHVQVAVTMTRHRAYTPTRMNTALNWPVQQRKTAVKTSDESNNTSVKSEPCTSDTKDATGAEVKSDENKPRQQNEEAKKVKYCSGPQFTVNRPILLELKRTCPNLTRLSLDYCNIGCSATKLEYFPRTLKYLSLRGTRCFNMSKTRTYLSNIQTQLPYLEELDVSRCTWLEASTLIPLSKLPKLRSLLMMECPKISECVAYSSLAAKYGFKALEKLDFSGTPVGDSEVSAFGWCCLLTELRLAPPGFYKREENSIPREGNPGNHMHYDDDPPVIAKGLGWEDHEPACFAEIGVEDGRSPIPDEEMPDEPRSPDRNHMHFDEFDNVIHVSLNRPTLPERAQHFDQIARSFNQRVQFGRDAFGNITIRRQGAPYQIPVPNRPEAAPDQPEPTPPPMPKRENCVQPEQVQARGSNAVKNRGVSKDAETQTQHIVIERREVEVLKAANQVGKEDKEAPPDAKKDMSMQCEENYSPSGPFVNKIFIDADTDTEPESESSDDGREDPREPCRKDRQQNVSESNAVEPGCGAPKPEGAPQPMDTETQATSGDRKRRFAKSDAVKPRPAAKPKQPELRMQPGPSGFVLLQQDEAQHHPIFRHVAPGVVKVGTASRGYIQSRAGPSGMGSSRAGPRAPEAAQDGPSPKRPRCSEQQGAARQPNNSSNKLEEDIEVEQIVWEESGEEQVVEGVLKELVDGPAEESGEEQVVEGVVEEFVDGPAAEAEGCNCACDSPSVLNFEVVIDQHSRDDHQRHDPRVHVIYVNARNVEPRPEQVNPPPPDRREPGDDPPARRIQLPNIPPAFFWSRPETDNRSRVEMERGLISHVMQWPSAGSNERPTSELMDSALLVSDHAIHRFGTSDLNQGNYVHIGPNGEIQMGAARPGMSDRPLKSKMRTLVLRGFILITDRTLQHLSSAAPDLRFLDVRNTKVTQKGVETFKLVSPDCVILSDFDE